MDVKRYIRVILPLRIDFEPIYSLPEGIAPSVGTRVKVCFAGKVYTGVVCEVDATPDIAQSKILSINSVENELPPIRQEEISLWRFMASYYMCTIGEVLKTAYPNLKTVGEENLATRKRKPKTLTEDGQTDQPFPEITLSEAQAEARLQICRAFKAGKPALLHGVTGSGKTEIYLTLARETLEKGRNVLFLVPEIALSRQLEDRLSRFFGDRLMTFHSARTSTRKVLMTKAVREAGPDKPYVILGTRSSVFLPHHDLGLIVVDEEHDSSYKQSSPTPRYNAREVAVVLAGICSSNIVLGSATPSLESLYNSRIGKYQYVRLSRRYYEGEDSDIEIIDTIAERKKNGMVGDLSRKLLARIDETLQCGGQIVVLRTRRAWSPIVQCESCGDIPKCPRCNATLSYHRDTGRLVCHYCGHSKPYAGICKKCGGTLTSVGAGTQKIEDELAKAFPQARIARLDSDSTQNKTYEKETIKGFSSGEIDILVGTQIVTKGFDFKGLALVVAIQADSMAVMDDFRADEHCLQLLEQLRGRSGRRGKKGLFVIQTSQAAHPVFKMLGNEDSTHMEGLLAEREAFGYPPFSRIVNLVVEDFNETRLDAMAGALARKLSEAVQVPITGPYHPFVDKISNRHIRHIRLQIPKDPSQAWNKKRIQETVTQFETERKYTDHIAIDVDPI